MGKYAVIDLEMCKVPEGCRSQKYKYASEIIQIAAVLLNEQLEITDQFNSYVAPQYGRIDSYIEKLTKITSRDVKDAPGFAQVWEKFTEWLPQDTVLVAWSDNDQRQIKREVEAKEICSARNDVLYESWIDCQQLFSDRIHRDKQYNLMDALNIADVEYKDGAHNGLVDAYNTALLFVKMNRETTLILNPYYKQLLVDEDSGSGFLLGTLLSKFAYSA